MKRNVYPAGKAPSLLLLEKAFFTFPSGYTFVHFLLFSEPRNLRDYKYLLYLKGQPQAIEDDEADNDEIEDYVFNADVRECEGVLEIKYSNKVLENLLEEYNYSSTEGSNTLVRFDFDAPEYYGVENLDCLTETLIASLIRTGNGEAGLEQALVDAFDDICDAFTSIEGTAEEEIDPVGRSWGYDFELKDGVYRAEERECYGGW